MSPLAAGYFDGKSSLRHEVSVLIGGGKVRLIGRDVSLEFEARKVRVAPRLADTPRWLYLPGGGACVLPDNDAVDSFARERPFPRLLYRLEARPAVAVAAVALVVGLLWLLIDRGLPPAVEYVAERIPRSAEKVLGEKTLAALSGEWFRPSELKRSRQETLHAKFDGLAKAAGDVGPMRLEFRSSPAIGANAFALPSGIIVVTDQLVRLARNDQQVLAVLAHEIGHVRYRHTMRHLLQGSATALIIAGVTGDIASTTSLAASAPALLLQTKYSRDFEREADRFAIDLLEQTGIGAENFAAILARLEARHKDRMGLPNFLSSHPPTAEREALAKARAAASSVAQEGSSESDERLAQLRPDRPPLAMIDPEQKRIAELLEKRDFAGLDQALDARRSAFESDAGAARPLENAFRTFEKLPRSSEPALNEWVKAAPGSYNARVARGSFHIARGLYERGEGYGSDVGQDHIDAMEAYFDSSLDDLEHSLALSEKPYLTRRYMMTIMLYTGSRAELQENYREALDLAPSSVETRLAYMRSLEPRWGGSHERMVKFVAKSRAELKPADADRLAARIAAYRGYEGIWAKDFRGAFAQLSEAVGLDADAQYLCERAYVDRELKRGEEAFRDAAAGLAKARDNRYCIRMATSSASQAGKPEDAVVAMNQVIETDPANLDAYVQRGWAYERLSKIDLAFPDYLAAARLGNAWAQLRVGRAYSSGTGVKRDPEEALAWLEKAAKQGEEGAQASLGEARKALGRPPQ